MKEAELKAENGGEGKKKSLSSANICLEGGE